MLLSMFVPVVIMKSFGWRSSNTMARRPPDTLTLPTEESGPPVNSSCSVGDCVAAQKEQTLDVIILCLSPTQCPSVARSSYPQNNGDRNESKRKQLFRPSRRQRCPLRRATDPQAHRPLRCSPASQLHRHLRLRCALLATWQDRTLCGEGADGPGS